MCGQEGKSNNKKKSVKKILILYQVLNFYLLELEKIEKLFYKGSAFLQYILFPV